MNEERLFPDYIFEISWEVCNKVGGIYTVLSTRAKTLQEKKKDCVAFIGPDVWKDKTNPLFSENKRLLPKWRAAFQAAGLHVRIGRWNIPGEPVALLVDFVPFFAKKDEIYGAMWNQFSVDSLHAYGDYDEASMFSYAAGRVVETVYRTCLKPESKVIYHAHEWMSGMGMLYIRQAVPQIATLFTTHATSIGRSICGNDKPLYDYLFAYQGDQMAEELNMQSKHSIEKQAAHHADCFTTVSELTNHECEELLDKQADVVLVNGFENDFVPSGAAFSRKRREARKILLNVASKLMGTHLGDDTLIVSTSGRNDFRCKGFDVYLESLARLNRAGLSTDVLALIEVPCWMEAPRQDLLGRLQADEDYDTPLPDPQLTHWLHNMDSDRILNLIRQHQLCNTASNRVKVMLVPCYLDGADGIFNKEYYDLLIGNDLCLYPSYYEPWGYTPLEAVAFRIPCITTNLAGFGLWVNSLKGKECTLEDGVYVISRNDSNYFEVAEQMKQAVCTWIELDEAQRQTVRKRARAIADKAQWKYFIQHYYTAYHVALLKARERMA